MVFRGLSAFRPGQRQRRILVVLGLCVVFHAAAASAWYGGISQVTSPEYDAAEKSMRQIRIKRLRPADPESTEVMLATRGLISFDSRVS
jgi:hypothetical protein